MNTLIVRPTIWKFEAIPKDLEEDFLKEIIKSYYEFATHKDSDGTTHLPIFEDVIADLRYAAVIESFYHCKNRKIPFDRDFFEDEIIGNVSEEEQEFQYDWLNKAYDLDIMNDGLQVLDNLHLAYTDSSESRNSTFLSLHIKEVW